MKFTYSLIAAYSFLKSTTPTIPTANATATLKILEDKYYFIKSENKKFMERCYTLMLNK